MPILLCAELVMCRVCYVPSWLCAEFAMCRVVPQSFSMSDYQNQNILLVTHQ